MKKIICCTVVWGSAVEANSKIMTLVQKGYVLHGGVAINNNGYIAQTMVLYEEVKKSDNLINFQDELEERIMLARRNYTGSITGLLEAKTLLQKHLEY